MPTSWKPLLTGPLAETATQSVREIAAALPGHGPEEGWSATLAGGQAGQSLFYAYLALHTAEPAAADRAADLLEAAADTLASVPLPPSLYAGFPGVAWTMEHLRGRLFEEDAEGEEAEDPLQEIDDALLGAVGRSPWQGDYDLIGGLAGLGVYALERLPHRSAALLLEAVVDRLAELAKPFEEGVSWFTPPEHLPAWQREIHPGGYYNLGLAHGMPAVVAVLAGATAAGAAAAKARPLLDGAVAWLLARRYEPGVGSCFGTSYNPGETPVPSRLAWCYGDAGVAAALLAAARAVGEPAWERQAVEVALVAAARDASTAYIHDAGLCHGAAGLGHLFNRMYQTTGEERLATAARAWFERALALRVAGEPVAGYRAFEIEPGSDQPKWRADPGFLEGATGVGLALLGAVSAVEPAWDRTLLVSLPPAPGD
jgi:hypothetical protein